MPREIVGIILAGGQSRRMGTDKAFLEIGGIPLIQRVLDVLLPIFPTVAIVAKDLEKFRHLKEVQLAQDLFTEQHALGGIYTALSTFGGKNCFVFSCDLPFLNAELIQAMIERQDGHDLFIPKSRRGLEPLHTLYTQRCLGTIERRILWRQWSLGGLVQRLNASILLPGQLHLFDPRELSFLNVNTPDGFQQAQGIVESRIVHSHEKTTPPCL